ncbi:MAG: hypothetical protein VR73_13935 [Gammaproteobacteria bacterium BRH_c0]|nr:MAG: hypothetical protein VR73_13935 [Gammaproteobacteria bacterium BRH_c0]
MKQMRKIPSTEGAIIRQRVNVELIDLSEARNVKAQTNTLIACALVATGYFLMSMTAISPSSFSKR